MGDGSNNDDLKRNGGIVAAFLERYYLPRGSTLILNGDIEDLQKFRLGRIRSPGAAYSPSSTASPARAGSTRSTATTTRPSSSRRAIPIPSAPA
jgi:hypothetical protein